MKAEEDARLAEEAKQAKAAQHSKQRMLEAFQRMDTNGNGSVSYKEFTVACSNDSDLCRNLSRGVFGEHGKAFLKKKEMSRIWELIDTDMDDILTQDELMRWWKARSEEEEGDAGVAESAGEMNAEEKGLELEDRNHTKRPFLKIDAENDLVVSHDEFVAACNNNEELCQLTTRGVCSKEGKRRLSKKRTSQLRQLMDSDLYDSLTQDEMMRWWESMAESLQQLRQAKQEAEAAAEHGLRGLVAHAQGRPRGLSCAGSPPNHAGLAHRLRRGLRVPTRKKLQQPLSTTIEAQPVKHDRLR